MPAAEAGDVRHDREARVGAGIPKAKTCRLPDSQPIVPQSCEKCTRHLSRFRAKFLAIFSQSLGMTLGMTLDDGPERLVPGLVVAQVLERTLGDHRAGEAQAGGALLRFCPS